MPTDARQGWGHTEIKEDAHPVIVPRLRRGGEMLAILSDLIDECYQRGLDAPEAAAFLLQHGVIVGGKGA